MPAMMKYANVDVKSMNDQMSANIVPALCQVVCGEGVEVEL